MLVRSYVWGPELGGGIGGLLSMKAHVTNQIFHPFYDGNGNVMGLTNDAGAVVATYEYDPFGKLISAEGPAAQ